MSELLKCNFSCLYASDEDEYKQNKGIKLKNKVIEK